MKTWRDIEELADRDTLKFLIEQEGTAPRIARRLGCSENSVRNAMKFHGLEPRYWRQKEAGKKLKL